MQPNPIAETEGPFVPSCRRGMSTVIYLPVNYVPPALHVAPASASVGERGGPARVLLCSRSEADMDDDGPDVITHLLRDYERTFHNLKRQDRLEKEASTTFSELAAKVKAEVDRRNGIDRRTTPRVTSDRRVRNELQPPGTVEST
jgi:hypothetical protein